MKHILFTLFGLILAIGLFSCEEERALETPRKTQATKTLKGPPKAVLSDTVIHQTILEKMANNYQQMAEKEIAVSKDQRVYAQYAMPVTRYRHAILGDAIEAGQLVVALDSVFYDIILPDTYVFEDIRPRLADVTNDGIPEIITIRSHVQQGAGIVIYQVKNGKLDTYAYLPEIGTRNRWLNIVTVSSLDDKTGPEIVWVQTPHIGGILKIANIQPGEINAFDETSLYSNHAIGETNLCLSAIAYKACRKTIYIPTQQRDAIVGFQVIDGAFKIADRIDMPIDFSQPLFDQYDFPNLIDKEINCIAP